MSSAMIVNHVYKPIAEACNLAGKEGNAKAAPEEKKSIGARLIDTITGIFTPILPAITAAGMLKAVLSILTAFPSAQHRQQYISGYQLYGRRGLLFPADFAGKFSSEEI